MTYNIVLTRKVNTYTSFKEGEYNSLKEVLV